jgi:hypothetical protein
LNREIAKFGHGAAAELAVGSLFRSERHPFSPIQSEPFIFNPTVENQGYRFDRRFC